ncbi:YopX family protein [Paenibacillus sp. FSL R5-0519]|uniref:YopX family protein n=1 Tax=Paenibacillus sp. FSL R5-0519 TaxID=2921648 RepID=UPI0030D70348
MREIQFRGMDINGTWHYGLLAILKQNYMKIEKGHYISNSMGLPFAYQVRPETVCLYTGSEDKNGKRIFAGDILRHYSDARMYLPDGSGGWSLQGDPKVEERAAVEWSEEYGCVHAWGQNLWVYSEKSEIIGNIWENKDLLQGDVDMNERS